MEPTPTPMPMPILELLLLLPLLLGVSVLGGGGDAPVSVAEEGGGLALAPALPREASAVEPVCVDAAVLDDGRPGSALVAPLPPPVGDVDSAVVLGTDGAGLVESPEGVWPAWNAMLCPVLRGNDATCARVFASLKATVVLAASVQLQNEPGWSVAGSPLCEQGAHSPSLLSHSVSAIHGWSAAGWVSGTYCVAI